MKRVTSLLTISSMLITLSAYGFTASAQLPNRPQDPFATPRKDLMKNLPPSAKIGASPEAKKAWEKLTPEQRKQVVERFRTLVDQAKLKVAKEKREQNVARKTYKDIIKDGQSGTDVSLLFADKQGNRRLIKAKEREANVTLDAVPSTQVSQTPPGNGSSQLAGATARKSNLLWGSASGFATFRKASFVKTSTTAMLQGGTDADFDGLPEEFENSVADAFTPIYHVSAYEPDNFATFGNYVPQTVQQRFGQNPISHFRVQPLGFAYNYYGQLVSVLRIDYLTLWDHDSGLAGSTACDFGTFGLGFLLEGARAHNLDNERSAVLVAAPVSDYTYNLDPLAYSAYSFFTTAHEGVWFFDQSRYYDFPTSPVPAGNHIHLALSRSKHGTYAFNPDYYPFTNPYLIASVFWSIYDLYYYGYIGEIEYYVLLYIAYGIFYGCIVERFDDQGGRFADLRINVGEPLNPINNSAFIQDTELYNKLIRGLW